MSDFTKLSLNNDMRRKKLKEYKEERLVNSKEYDMKKIINDALIL